MTEYGFQNRNIQQSWLYKDITPTMILWKRYQWYYSPCFCFSPAANTMTPLFEATSRSWNPGWRHWSGSAVWWTGTSRRCRRWSRRCKGKIAWWACRTLATGRDIQSRSLRGGRSPCATGRTKYGKDGADVKEFSQTIHHEVGGHELVKLLGAILLFWKHSIMRFKTYFVCKGSITNWE